MNDKTKAKITLVKKPRTEAQKFYGSQESEEVECKSLLALECYDCEEENNYTHSDIYDYYDAEHGIIQAFTCKSCGSTNVS